jgi:uncharacterized HAD superfamily protein
MILEANMNYRNFSDLAKTIRSNLHLIPRLPVVGIPRSGMIAASMIATLKHAPLFTLGDMLPSKFLLVDDSVSGGQTFAKAIKQLPEQCEFTTLAVYRKPSSPPVGITLETLPGPRVFEWNWAKHYHLRNALLDIDGVICENGDGYSLDHINNAKPLHIPRQKVKALATGRREEHRAETEAWLKKHNVQYGKLFMAHPGCHGRHVKRVAAQEVNPTWIVESDISQAGYLAQYLELPVLCTDANAMMYYQL